MEMRISLDAIFAPSENVVAREVQGEFIIIPITSGVGDLVDEIFTLNQTAKAIWDNLDGKKTLKEVAKVLSRDFEASLEKIEKDILGLAKELFKRKMLIKTKRT